ncbi:MAG: class I SAM-dependent methyltransferase [Oscillospiraceae bacterium]|nr:class I SAM-dependent methyltransferase [Oscillospiraceae bacterium]
METGWEREKRTYFDEIVAGYDKVRPEYPTELFEDIFKYSEIKKEPKALEIGAGTGKATAPFLNAGYNITAVEIGGNMTDFLRDRFKGFPDFNVITAAFEEALLEENSFDLMYAASSFHWIDAEKGCPKVFNLLKSDGIFALLRYNFNVIPVGGKLHNEIQAVYEKHYYSYYKSKKRPEDISKRNFNKPSEILNGYGFEDLSAFGFHNVSMNLYPASKTYSAYEWFDFLETLSDHRNLPNSNRTALYAGVKNAIQKNGGFYNVDFIFQLYMGRK